MFFYVPDAHHTVLLKLKCGQSILKTIVHLTQRKGKAQGPPLSKQKLDVTSIIMAYKPPGYLALDEKKVPHHEECLLFYRNYLEACRSESIL